MIEAESKEIVAQDEPEVETVEEEVEVLEKIDVFDEIESIDDETAKNLYKSGFTSIDSLTIATVKDIAKTPGIKKRKAKQIKKEIDKKSKEIQGYKPPETSESQEVEITEEQIENIEDSVQLEEKTLAFSELDSVDSETAVLLYDNGCTTVDSLKNKTIKDLCKIKGIKKKKAKKIVAEIDKKIEESLNVKPINIDETAEGEVSEEQIKNDTDFKEEKSKLNPVELSSTDAEWNPVQEDVELQEEKPSHDGEAEEKESIDEKYEKIEDLKEIINIDDDTAVVLYDAGYKTIESLRDVKVKDLTKIKIKKKRAKAIIKDIEEHFKIFESNDSMIKEDDEEYFLEDDDEGEALEIEDKIKEFQEPTAEVVEEEFAEELVEDVPEIEVEEERDDVFKEISSIDKKISDLLLNNGVDTLEKLNEKTIKELTKIKGIRKKVAKQIKKDVEKYLNMNNEEEESYDNVNDNPYLADEDDEWETFDEESGKSEAFMHGGYTLYEKEITTKSGNQRLVRFFSKGQPDDAEPIDIPDGFEVIENKKTGVPYLRKIK